MIGLVIVSHSDTLAKGVCELVEQMTQGQVPLAAAGGIDDPQHPIGTDAFRVQQAIESVYSDDGVIIFMDLGSALLSAETALDFLPPEQQARVYLCEAPLVEGAMAAAAQAMAGSNVDQVMAEARGALAAKAAQLQQAAPAISPAAPPVTPAAPQTRLTVRNPHGLHARPAARFVNTAARFQAQITLSNATQNTGPVSAKSINQVATLGIRQGHEIVVMAEGPDAVEALVALEALVNSNFGEAGPPPAVTVATPATKELAGIPASPGIAIGPVAQYHPAPIAVPEHSIEDPQAESRRLQAAIQAARQEIETLHRQAVTQVGPQEAAIFEAHLLFLQDPALVEAAHRRIFDQSINAEAAWHGVVNDMASTYRALDDPYLQARATDVSDVGQRVLKLMVGVKPAHFELSEPAILVAADLTPSDTAQLDAGRVLGICTQLGSAASHSAILARALGIPAVVGLGPSISRLTNGTLLAFNGKTGQVWIEPKADKLATLQQQRDEWLAAQHAARAASRQPAQTSDGRRVEVVANIGSLADVKAALDNGAEGVGLLRTEFLYLNRAAAPTEDEQFEIYKAIAGALGTRPLIIRTLDIGGDKPLPYLELEPEANPFLGWRGLRLCLGRPDLLTTQLRAILRASPGHNIKIMFPMVSTVTEIRAAKKILAQAQAELQQEGQPYEQTIETGIMIEVPAAVAMAGPLATEVDFFSLGTNDLTQYTMAADRTNARVAALADPFQPALLRSIHQTIQAAHQAGIWVGLCGEFAGDPLATPILLGLGLDEFSMSAPAIPIVKQTLAQLTTTQSQAIAQTILNFDTAEAIREYVKKEMTVDN